MKTSRAAIGLLAVCLAACGGSGAGGGDGETDTAIDDGSEGAPDTTSDPAGEDDPDTGHESPWDAEWDVPDGPPPDPDALCEPPVGLADTSSPDRIVGEGSAETCTEEALREAVSAGGIVTFDCGDDPVTITLEDEIVIGVDTVIDGEGRVTLSGGGTTRILNMDTGNFEATGPGLTVQRLGFVDGHATGTPFELGIETDGGGGAIYFVGGSVTVVDCSFVGNVAAEIGPDVAGGAVYGIGVGESVIVGSTFTGNRAANGGAVGALHTAITLVNSTLTGNVATGWGANWVDEHGDQQGHGGNGGAVVMDGVGRTLEICGCTITDNSAGALGGALFRTGYESEPTIISLTTISGNEARDPWPEDLPSGGGGCYIQGTTVTMTATTISGNAANAFAGLWILGHGSAQAVADLTNVTIADNWTWPRDPFTDRGIGGGLTIGDNTVGTILNCTIAGNQAQFASGIAGVSPLDVRNTIISNAADNEWTPLNCTGSSYASPPGAGEDNIQWPTGLSDDDMDCTPGILRADPMLGPLEDHGGPTLTMAPLPGSPAEAGGHDCPPTDQRGEPRSEPCTIGAHELP